MAVKRLRQEETQTETEAYADADAETGLSDMPESLQLHILSFLDTKHAVETSVLSKSWVSSWSCVPVLNFSSDSFQQIDAFDNFVLNALSRRQPVKLDRLTFKHGRRCTAEILKQVFDYAFSHGVQELEVSIGYSIDEHEILIWPIWASGSLTSLKLESIIIPMHWSFLEPRYSGSFKTLTNLLLEWVIIRDLDTFSGFPVLDKLTLFYCQLQTNGRALNVHALRLSEFAFVKYRPDVGHCEFTTPKLRCFKWSGNCLPRLKAHFPVLDTAVIDYNGHCNNQEKAMLDNLLMIFNTLCNAKSLTLSAHVIRLLTLFPVNECSPFRNLKCLKLDFEVDPMYIISELFLSETLKLVPGVKAYLLHNSCDAKCTIINHPDGESESTCSSTQKSIGVIRPSRDKQGQKSGPTVTQSRPKRMVKKPARFLD